MKKYKIKSFEFDDYTLVLLALTLIAFVLRVLNVGYLTLWVDEYIHVNGASSFPEQPLWGADNNGILYTMFVIPLFKLFAVNEFWARFPSVVFGTLTIPLIYWFGKKYFNRYIGLFAAVLLTFSQYHVFLSRIARFYAIFVFFFLLFALYLGKTMDVKNEWKPIKNKFFDYLRCTPKNLGLTVVLLLLSLISNQMTFLVIYSIGFYHFVLFLVRLYRKECNFLSLNAIITYGFVFFCAMTFVPAFQSFLKIFLFILFPENYWNFLPELDRLKALMETEPYKTFHLYLAVPQTDYPLLWIAGIIGFVWAFFRFKKSALLNFSLSAVLFFLMSFIYREPFLPRYIVYLYPFFLIAIAVMFYEIVVWIKRKYPKKAESLVYLLLVVLIFLTPIKQSFTMVTHLKHGQVAPRALSNLYFPYWKATLNNLKPQLGENDVLLSTMPVHLNFYLGRDAHSFRQRFYNPAKYQYENLPVDTIHPNAASTQGLAKLLQDNDRVWFVADYYFNANNPHSDPETKDYVLQNMRFEFNMSNKYISVFSWNKERPITQPAAMFESVSSESPSSFPYTVQFPPGNSDVQMALDVEGITRENEMMVTINGNKSAIPRATGEIYKQTGDSRSRQYYIIPVPRQIIRESDNKVSFELNSRGKQDNDRFVVYNVLFSE
ncbi:hypothetical protein AGMMS4957_19450 [Bacteroidia bacterium]|nr:hypothetical protein AGMMS4957_19450 [Bacteroidia bacterium]